MTISKLAFLTKKHERTTRVLPIVGLDVGAIDSSSLFSFCSGRTFAIWLFVVIFDFSFSIELRLPGGDFSILPPSAILVRKLQPYWTHPKYLTVIFAPWDID